MQGSRRDKLPTDGAHERLETNRADFWDPEPYSIAERMEQSSLCSFDLRATAPDGHNPSTQAVQIVKPGKTWRDTWGRSYEQLAA